MPKNKAFIIRLKGIEPNAIIKIANKSAKKIE